MSVDAPKKQNAGALVAAVLVSDSFQLKVKQALPQGVTADKFTRACITTLQKFPDIVERGDKSSLYSAIVESAQAGLLCDGKQAALALFDTNVGTKQNPRWIKKVQFMPMVAGIKLNLARVGAATNVHEVYEADEFDYQYGDNPFINHKPAKLGTPRGEMIGAYAIIKKGDIANYTVMDVQQIEAVRSISRQPNALMWTTFKSEGYCKTVLRRCAKGVPITDEILARTMKADDETFTFDGNEEITPPDPSVVSTQGPEGDVPVQTERKKRGKALQAVVDAKDDHPEKTAQTEQKSDDSPPPYGDDDVPQELRGNASRPRPDTPASDPQAERKEADLF